MTFAANETSVESGRPIELYTFSSALEVLRFTSAEDDQLVAGNTYVAIPIKRSRISQGQEARTASLTIEMPSDESLPSRYVASAPSRVTTVTIQRLHRGDSELATFFVGVVKSVAFSDDGRKAKIAVDPAISATGRQVPHVTFRGQCNNVLYDAQDGGLCDVDPESPSFKFTGAATAVSGLTITVPGLAAFGTGWFDAGTVETSAGLDARMVVRQVGDVLTLHIAFPFNVVGETMIVRAGCAHDINTCSTKFGRVGVYQGWAFVPRINPFESGLSVEVC